MVSNVGELSRGIPSFAGRRVHMVGIGGSGMSGAAAMLLRLGATVSGSDRGQFDGLGALAAAGARVSIGHREEQLGPDVDLVVISAAIPEHNPELAAARRRTLPVIKYAALVGQLMRHCRGIAIAGTHGKSTTTALTAFLFREAGVSPSFVVGARSEQLGGSSAAGDGAHFIVEACEYDRSFHNFDPAIAAILNIEPDHLDCYGDLEAIIAAFNEFGRKVPADGLVVCNADDLSVARAVRDVHASVTTFGFSEAADWRGTKLREDRGRFAFDVEHCGRRVLSTHLSIPGRHNVANALAAIAIASHEGLSAESLGAAVPRFAGVSRRLTYRGEHSGVTIVDDYAHHPTEIRVTIEAARGRYQPKRTWVIFQPHQSSRTRLLMDEFATSFQLADEIIVPDVYGAREGEMADNQAGSAELVSRICRHGKRATYISSLDAVTEHLSRHVADGDMVLTMGAGDVWKVADDLVERIR